MGEQGHPLISGHIWSPIMRSSRGKFFVYLAVLGTMCFVVFLLSSTHSNLKQLEGVNEKCQQQRDSLSAQLQVVYEHKNRLEKSLQQEKTDHKHTKEEFEEQRNKKELESKKSTEETNRLKKQISELKSSFTDLETDKKHIEESLKEQLESLQTQKDEELKKLQAQVNELASDKVKIEQSKSSLAWKVDQHVREMDLCRSQYQQLNEKFSECHNQLKNSKLTVTKFPSSSEIPQIEIKKDHNQTQDEKTVAKSLPSPKGQPYVFERPHVQQFPDNNDNEIERNSNGLSNKDAHKQSPLQQNGNEVNNISQINQKHQLPLPLLLPDKQAHDVKAQDKDNNVNKGLFNDQREGDNLHQVQPPPDHGINQPAEKGEYPNGLMGQLEQPDFKDTNHVDEQAAASNLRKNVLPPPNINEQEGANADAQVQDMMDKSPGDTNDIRNNPLHVPAVHGLIDAMPKMNFNREPHLPKGRAELPDDKQYADEDDDDLEGDNEDDMGAGAGQQVRGKVFHEPDFDDQEPNENNVKEEEGVVVAPK